MVVAMTGDITADRTVELSEVEQLRSEVRALREALEMLGVRPSPEGPSGPSPALDHATNRRGLLRLAGAAAVGAIGATAAAAAPAAAETGYTTGGATAVGDVVTQTLNGSVPGKNGFQFATFGGPANNVSSTPAVVAALAVDPAARRAIYAHSAVQFGIGVQGVTPAEVDGVGVQGEGITGVRGVGGLIGVVGSGDTGVSAIGTDIGGVFSGSRVALRLGALGSPPPVRAVEFATGEITVDENGALWFCTSGGRPGRWRKVSGPTTAGSFHALDPTRVYDSRVAAPTPGRLGSGTSRTIDLERPRNVTTGAATSFFAVPRQSVAAVLSVQVVDPRGRGELEILRNGLGTQSSRQMVWETPGVDLATQITTRVSPDSKVRVRCRGRGSCHLVVDVLGYYQ